MARKLRSGGATSATQLDRTKKFKYNDAGTLVEFTGNEGATDIVFTGSKSNLRRIADLERNVSILAASLKTTDGAATDADDASFPVKFTDAARFKDSARFDDAVDINANVDISAQITISGQTTIGGGYGSTGVTLSADGDLSMDGNAVVDGSITLGGGYGSTGVTISAAGAISADGLITAAGGITVSGGTATITTADINGGAIDGTAIGASSASTVAATTLTTTGNATIGGNLTVSGTTTTVNSNVVNIGDSTLTLNSDETGAPSENGGIEIERGTSTNVSFLWNETDDQWTTGTETIKAGHILPAADETYDLGSADLKYRDLYLSGSTIKLGGAEISASGSNLSIGGSGELDANASTASRWKTSRTFTIDGSVDGSVSFNGASNPTLTVTPANDAVTLGTHTSGNYVAAGAVAGNGLSGSAGAEGATFTVTSNATTAASANTIAYRDGSGGINSVGLNAGSGNVLSTGYFGRDANDYIAWSNDSHSVIFVAGTERLRVTTSGLDISGSIVADSDITAFSDERLKSNVELIPDALAKINELDGFTYDMEDREGNVLGRKTGVIAQHVQKVLPEAVVADEDGYLSVAYGNMVGLLIQGMNEMTANLSDAHKTLGMQSDVIAQQGETIKKMQKQIDEILEGTITL
tara:strand:- start:2143 stop:4071 length:1929 start_codon:yes stop_codon:yes gene_type:complete